MMDFSERNVAKKLRHVGRKLLKHSSVNKLLPLLDKLELLLSTLDQEPTKPIQESLVPSMKALISDELLRHTDEDVKISVTSCINEITRITAPDVPYDDEQMKEIFKLTVASFEKLSHISGRGYEKVLTILDNVNKVRLCLVMLDLECNDLVIEMFQHFLRFIRSNHPRNAIHSMESIMILILQESEQISPDLLRPLLDSVGNENQTISPMSWTLGEKVISNCAVNLKPYLMKAVESSGRAINEYAQIVTDICQNTPGSPHCDDSNCCKKTVVQEVENKLDLPRNTVELPCDVQEAQNKLDVPKDAEEQPSDVQEAENILDAPKDAEEQPSNVQEAENILDAPKDAEEQPSNVQEAENILDAPKDAEEQPSNVQEAENILDAPKDAEEQPSNVQEAENILDAPKDAEEQPSNVQEAENILDAPKDAEEQPSNVQEAENILDAPKDAEEQPSNVQEAENILDAPKDAEEQPSNVQEAENILDAPKDAEEQPSNVQEAENILDAPKDAEEQPSNVQEAENILDAPKDAEEQPSNVQEAENILDAPKDAEEQPSNVQEAENKDVPKDAEEQPCDVQEAENKLDVPKDAEEQPCDVQEAENKDVPKDAEEQPCDVQEAENKLDVPKDAEEQPCDETKGHGLDITGEREVHILNDTKSNIRNGASTMDGEAIKKSGSKKRPHSEITKNSKRGSAKANLETDNLESVEEPNLETQLNTVPRKRGRKPNSLINVEEGYDHSWIYQETKPGKSALSRKARYCSSPFPSSEKPTSRKDKLHRKPKTGSETLVSKPKSESIAKPAQSRRTQNISSNFPPNDTSEVREALASKPKTGENTDAASVNNNIPDGHHIKRGQPRKINSTGNQDVRSNSVSMLKEDNLNSLLKKTSLDSPTVRLEKESEVRKDSELKPIRKIKFSVRIDGKLVVAPESVARREPNVSSGDEGKLTSSMNVVLENIEEVRSSAQTDVKKRRRLNATPNKGLNKSSAVKELIVESANKTLRGVKETPQTRLRRRHVIASVEATESHDDGNSLVGRRIKVWWPKDKMFYEGVIDSYDPIKGKHKILYADGDVEVLNLKRQRWEPVDVDVLLDEEGLALQRLAEASDIAEKGKEKSELESAKGENINSKSRGRASASVSISKSEYVKCADISAVDLADDSPIIFSRKDSRMSKTKRRRA